jgi:hypothetical protein
MMRRWIMLFCVGLMIVYPLQAQTDDSACDIELSEAVALMVRAQAQASGGD